MGADNANIQRLSFEEIQEFKDLNLFELTWEQTNGRRVLLAYDPRSQTFGYSYAEPGTDGGDQNISIFYGYSSLIARFIDNGELSARPSINGFDNNDGIIAMSTNGSVTKFDFFDVEIDAENNIDRYVFRMSMNKTITNGITPVKGVDYFDGITPVKGVDYFDGYTPVKGTDFFDGVTPVKGTDYFDGYTPVKGVDYFDGAPAVTNYQKIITYPQDFLNGVYTVSQADNEYVIIIDNGPNDVVIELPFNVSKTCIGYIQRGTGAISFSSINGLINTPIPGAYKIRGQFFQAYSYQKHFSSEFFLLGNIKV